MSPSYKQNLPLGISITILSYLFFATSGAFVKLVDHNFPSVEILLFQNIFCLICVIPYALVRWRRPFNIQKNWRLHLTRDLAGFISYLLYFLAIKSTNLIDATVLSYTTPFFTPFVWWIWTKEKSTNKIWWAIVLGFIGIALILKPSHGIFQIGAILGLLAGMFSSLVLVSIRILNNHMEPISKTLILFFCSSILIGTPLSIPVWVTPTSEQFLLLFGIGFMTTVAQILLTFAYRFGTASYLSPLSYCMVIFMTIISWFFFHLSPDLASGLGTILIVIGGSLTYIIKRKPKTVLEVFQRTNHIRLKKWISHIPFLKKYKY